MRALKAAGTPSARAHWINPPAYYLKTGWAISRRYAVLNWRLP
jgi:hypothetical protein